MKDNEKEIEKPDWTKSSDELPEFNVGVFVYIPEEDNHITSGMWDISKKWVLLDEYRIPKSEVTYWRPMFEKPKDGTYTPTDHTDEEDGMSHLIRKLQIDNFTLQKEVESLKAERDFNKENYEGLSGYLKDLTKINVDNMLFPDASNDDARARKGIKKGESFMTYMVKRYHQSMEEKRKVEAENNKLKKKQK